MKDSLKLHCFTVAANFIAGGAVVIDTPGMRELQLTDCDEGSDEGKMGRSAFLVN